MIQSAWFLAPELFTTPLAAEWPQTRAASMNMTDLKKAIDPVFATTEVANDSEQDDRTRHAAGCRKGSPRQSKQNRRPDAKQIYVYKDLKVVFANNAVADVQ
jgi:hypothetical protein